MPALVSKLGSQELIFCNQCKVATNHMCQAEHVRERTEPDGFWVEHWFRFWLCAGCEEATLEVCLIHAGCAGPEDYESRYYPGRGVTARRFWRVPGKLDGIYQETVEAFNQGLSILCAAGLRALLEGVCENKGVQGNNLERRINALTAILPEDIVENLHAFRSIGNTALHKLAPPGKDILRLAIEVIEDLLNFLYELGGKSGQLARVVEPVVGSVGRQQL